MKEIEKIIKDTKKDYKQKIMALAKEAENGLQYVALSKEAREYMENKMIDDLYEGNAPYRPRYVLPDYDKYLKNGSEYLSVKPPEDMYEAINALLILYNYVPSITGFPVYLGQVDELLEPFTKTVTERELDNLIKMYLNYIDKVLSDAFVHLNIGPTDTKVGRAILKNEKILKKAVPNISLKYSKETPKSFVLMAIDTALEVSKPYFVNNDEISNFLGRDYAVSSCYNTLKIGGGSHTLVRLNLFEVAKRSKDYQDFMNNMLPKSIDLLCEIINKRAKYLVEEVKFFESSFLVKEGLIDINKFTSMAGFYGLFECVEELTNGLKLGTDEKADQRGEEILKEVFETVKSKEGLYCGGFGGKIAVHAQSGIDTDKGVTAGVRIKIGSEPDIIYNQIRTQGRLHKYFDAGVSDIYVFDKTAKKNKEGILTIIDAAMKKGIQIFSLGSSDSDVIRITGYLMKKSDAQKYFNDEQYRENTILFGAATMENGRILDRKVWKNDSED